MATASNPPPAEPLPGRRSFFRWLTYGLGAVAAAAMGVPFVGYLFGARKAPVQWLPLGPVTGFPQSQTRRATRPCRTPCDTRRNRPKEVGQAFQPDRQAGKPDLRGNSP